MTPFHQMNKLIICAVCIAITTAAAAAPSAPDYYKGNLNIKDVTEVCSKVNSWQMTNHIKDSNHDLGWIHGAYYRGLLEWAKQKGDMLSIGYFYGFAAANNWSLSNKLTYTHADEICLGQSYVEMYRIFKDPLMINELSSRAYYIATHPCNTSISHQNTKENDLRWTWCDALFMAAPVYAALFAVTGDQVYSDYLEREFWATYDYLYDKEEKLFHRDDLSFDRREENGRKIFWGRGNGWVAATIPLILENIPDNYPSRGRYEALLVELLSSIIKCQDENGSWHASMLDAVAYPDPENSGSAFFCYSLAWALNHGIVKGSEYWNALKKGWKAVVSCVYPEGKLGYVQRPGASPKKVEPKRSELYGSGAFLLAGSEICRLLGEKPAVKVK